MKVVLVMAVTADGKIAQDADQVSLDWTSPEDTKFFVKKTKEARAMIMGNTTFQTIGRPLPGRLSMVMTRNEKMLSQSLPDQVEYTTAKPKDILENLEKRGYEQVALIGGATINSVFLKAELIDEIFLTIEPKIFGKGLPLFKDMQVDVNLELAEIQKLSDNVVNVHYIIKK